jgi:hypothetical protein
MRDRVGVFVFILCGGRDARQGRQHKSAVCLLWLRLTFCVCAVCVWELKNAAHNKECCTRAGQSQSSPQTKQHKKKLTQTAGVLYAAAHGPLYGP